MVNKQSYQAYAAATQTVAKTKQVVMLYDAAIKSVKQGIEAIERDDIQTRYNSLTKACDIVFGMQGSLDFDSGGEVAQTLYDFYSSIDARLINVHRTNDVAACQQVLSELKQMRDAWAEIDKMDEDGRLKDPSAATTSDKPVPPDNSKPPEGGVAISA